MKQASRKPMVQCHWSPSALRDGVEGHGVVPEEDDVVPTDADVHLHRVHAGGQARSRGGSRVLASNLGADRDR